MLYVHEKKKYNFPCYNTQYSPLLKAIIKSLNQIVYSFAKQNKFSPLDLAKNIHITSEHVPYHKRTWLYGGGGGVQRVVYPRNSCIRDLCKADIRDIDIRDDYTLAEPGLSILNICAEEN